MAAADDAAHVGLRASSAPRRRDSCSCRSGASSARAAPSRSGTRRRPPASAASCCVVEDHAPVAPLRRPRIARRRLRVQREIARLRRAEEKRDVGRGRGGLVGRAGFARRRIAGDPARARDRPAAPSRPCRDRAANCPPRMSISTKGASVTFSPRAFRSWIARTTERSLGLPP